MEMPPVHSRVAGLPVIDPRTLPKDLTSANLFQLETQARGGTKLGPLEVNGGTSWSNAREHRIASGTIGGSAAYTTTFELPANTLDDALAHARQLEVELVDGPALRLPRYTDGGVTSTDNDFNRHGMFDRATRPVIAVINDAANGRYLATAFDEGLWNRQADVTGGQVLRPHVEIQRRMTPLHDSLEAVVHLGEVLPAGAVGSPVESRLVQEGGVSLAAARANPREAARAAGAVAGAAATTVAEPVLERAGQARWAAEDAADHARDRVTDARYAADDAMAGARDAAVDAAGAVRDRIGETDRRDLAVAGVAAAAAAAAGVGGYAVLRRSRQ